MVRAKFKVAAIERVKYGEQEVQNIRMTPVVSGSEENKKFFQYTPSGAITIGTVNPEAAAGFELGAEYYVDFTPAQAQQ